MSARGHEIAENLSVVRRRLDDACTAAGRDPDCVQLLAVTKFFPASDVAHLLDLGCTAFGEARAQEAGAKVAELTALRPTASPQWHVIGQLQRNKARAVLRSAHRVDSVDSERLLGALDRAAGAAVEGGTRAGPSDVLVQVSLDGDPQRGGTPLGQLSIGMSGNLESVVRHGASCVRVGTSLLGSRPITSTISRTLTEGRSS